MRKTLLLSEIFPPVKGGSGRWFWEVYTRLPAENIVVAAGQTESAYNFDTTSPLKTYRLPLSSHSWGLKSKSGLLYYWRVYREVRRLIKNEKIEILHCGRCLPEGFIGYLIKKLHGIPYICYIHGEDVETAATSRELTWIVNKALNGATKLICNSQNSARILLDKWDSPPSKTFVINPGVDALQFSPATPDENIKATLNWENRNVILTVGRLQERKGHDMLMKALPAIVDKFPLTLYAIIGNGEQKEHLKKLVETLSMEKHVMFMDEINDQQMIQCYQQCDVFVLPNRTVDNDIEGFGIVLVEAQACGKPVIAGNSGGTSETMKINESGFIVDCNTPNELVKKISYLFSYPDKANEMGKLGRAHVESTLDWKQLIILIKQHFN
ncbi:glycosyltransferase family 4 protein [Paraglaciecola sp. 25GB23A]|uniref:glycosyltransferase family 4 protein n=1 Tax=Paraglaciecola sp. 25GB23A TaxID=3156068 RepID=UPI0032AF50B2